MRKILYILSIVLIFSSCMKDADFNAYRVELTISLDDYPDIDIASVVGATVKLTHNEKAYACEAEVNAEGVAIFDLVEPGFYSATMSYQFRDGLDLYNLNSLKPISTFENVEEDLPVVVSKANSLVIKEYYYNGSLTPASKSYYDDQYVEIYNNTDEVLYADGLSLVEHESSGTSTNYWEFLTGSIVVKMIWTIPGDGDDHPIQPGESIVLCRDGFNHKSDPLGNPNSPVDMGNADFEFWVDRADGKDIDYPQVDNMLEELFVYRGTDIAFGVSGTSAIALAFISLDPAERQAHIDNNLIAKEGSTRYCCILPVEMVGDAVEVVRDEARSEYKRFPVELDAGYTYTASGSKSGKCIRRKVKEVVGGRVVYQDTNNSTEDFLKDVDPKPWIYE